MEKKAFFGFGTKKKKKEDAREGLWSSYMDDKTDIALDTLLKAYEPEMNMRIARFSAAKVPRSAMKDFARKKAIRAFDTFDPNRGAKLSTWVTHNIRNIAEDINKYKSTIKIRGKRDRLIGDLKDTRAMFMDVHDREPTLEELATEMGEPTRIVAKAMAELNPGYSPITMESDPFHTGTMTPELQQAMRIVRIGLNDQERLIWDYKLGINGQRRVPKQSEIAKLVGVSDGTVTRTIQRITRELEELEVL